MTSAPTIFLTDAAISAFKNKLKNKDANTCIRVGVKGGECEGYGYVIKFENKPQRECDIKYIFDDLIVLVDNKSINYLKGCTIDWEKKLSETGFIFSNPNSVSSCGCGESFSIKDK